MSGRRAWSKTIVACFRTAAIGLAVLLGDLDSLLANPESLATNAPARGLESVAHPKPASAELSEKSLLPDAGREGDRTADGHASLRESQSLFSSSNLRPASEKRGGPSAPNYKALLDQALDQKRGHNVAEAEKLLDRLLQAPAPPALHKTALLELAVLAHERQDLPRAQQIYAQYITRFNEDEVVPELLLRQGLLFRQMGAPVMALSKFYAVLSSSLHLKQDRLEYYQRLVLQAQSEIAETYYLQAKHDEAAEYFSRLLKLDSPELDKSQILYKLIRSLAARSRHEEVITQARAFLTRYPEAEPSAEVQFLLAGALKKLGRNHDAMQQVLTLLESQQKVADRTPRSWVYWRQRTGNELANQLYQEGDYVNALQIYQTLATLNPALDWQLPALYQVGLVYERLRQPEKANDTFNKMIQLGTASTTNNLSPTLVALIDMAKWRHNFIGWQQRADATNQRLRLTEPEPPTAHE